MGLKIKSEYSHTNVTLEKTEVAIKNGQSRETGSIGCIRHWTMTNKAKNTTQKYKNMTNTDPTKNTYIF